MIPCTLPPPPMCTPPPPPHACTLPPPPSCVYSSPSPSSVYSPPSPLIHVLSPSPLIRVLFPLPSSSMSSSPSPSYVYTSPLSPCLCFGLTKSTSHQRGSNNGILLDHSSSSQYIIPSAFLASATASSKLAHLNLQILNHHSSAMWMTLVPRVPGTAPYLCQGQPPTYARDSPLLMPGTAPYLCRCSSPEDIGFTSIADTLFKNTSDQLDRVHFLAASCMETGAWSNVWSLGHGHM